MFGIQIGGGGGGGGGSGGGGGGDIGGGGGGGALFTRLLEALPTPSESELAEAYSADSRRHGALLASTSPFNAEQHSTLLSDLVRAGTAGGLDLLLVCRSVQRFAPVHLETEQPVTVEEAMLLWINKVAGVVNGLQRDTNPQSTPIAPIISDLACALWDGRALCCLVAYYKPTLIAVGEIIHEENNNGGSASSWQNRTDPDAAAAAEDNLELARMVAVQLGCPCPATAADLMSASPLTTPVVQAWLVQLFATLEKQPQDARLQLVPAFPTTNTALNPNPTPSSSSSGGSRPQSRKSGRPASAAGHRNTSGKTGTGNDDAGRPQSARLASMRGSSAGRPASAGGPLGTIQRSIARPLSGRPSSARGRRDANSSAASGGGGGGGGNSGSGAAGYQSMPQHDGDGMKEPPQTQMPAYSVETQQIADAAHSTAAHHSIRSATRPPSARRTQSKIVAGTSGSVRPPARPGSATRGASASASASAEVGRPPKSASSKKAGKMPRVRAPKEFDHFDKAVAEYEDHEQRVQDDCEEDAYAMVELDARHVLPDPDPEQGAAQLAWHERHNEDDVNGSQWESGSERSDADLLEEVDGRTINVINGGGDNGGEAEAEVGHGNGKYGYSTAHDQQAHEAKEEHGHDRGSSIEPLPETKEANLLQEMQTEAEGEAAAAAAVAREDASLSGGPAFEPEKQAQQHAPNGSDVDAFPELDQPPSLSPFPAPAPDVAADAAFSSVTAAAVAANNSSAGTTAITSRTAATNMASAAASSTKSKRASNVAGAASATAQVRPGTSTIARPSNRALPDVSSLNVPNVEEDGKGAADDANDVNANVAAAGDGYDAETPAPALKRRLSSATARQADEVAEKMLLKLHPEIIEQRAAEAQALLDAEEEARTGKKIKKKKKGAKKIERKGSVTESRAQSVAEKRASTSGSRPSSVIEGEDCFRPDSATSSINGSSAGHSRPVSRAASTESTGGAGHLDEQSGELMDDEAMSLLRTPPPAPLLQVDPGAVAEHPEIQSALLRTEDDVMELLRARNAKAEAAEAAALEEARAADAAEARLKADQRFVEEAKATARAAEAAKVRAAEAAAIAKEEEEEQAAKAKQAAATAAAAVASAASIASTAAGSPSPRRRRWDNNNNNSNAGAVTVLVDSNAAFKDVGASVANDETLRKASHWLERDASVNKELSQTARTKDVLTVASLAVRPAALPAPPMHGQDAADAAQLAHDLKLKRQDIEQTTEQARLRLAAVHRASRQAAMRNILKGKSKSPKRERKVADAIVGGSTYGSAAVRQPPPPPPQQQQQPKRELIVTATESTWQQQGGAPTAAQLPDQTSLSSQTATTATTTGFSTGFTIPSDGPAVSPAAAARHEKLLRARHRKRVEERERRKARAHALAQYPTQDMQQQQQEEEEEEEEEEEGEDKRYDVHSPASLGQIPHPMPQGGAMPPHPKAALSFGLPQHHAKEHQKHSHQVGAAPDLTSPSKRGAGAGAGTARRTASNGRALSKAGSPSAHKPNSTRPTSRQAPQETTDAEGRNVKLKQKSNKQLMRNAITHTCLAGPVNRDAKDLVLKELDASSAAHYIILLHDPNDIKYRAVYSFDLEEGKGRKVAGRGPSTLKASRITHYFRYNSGTRRFTPMGTSQVSQMVDAVCLQKVAKKRHQQNQPLIINAP